MLKESFIHLQHIGPSRERYLWKSGVKEWKDVGDNINSLRMPQKAKLSLTQGCEESIKNFEEKNYSFFAKRFDTKDIFRVYPYIEERTLFLDIETRGFRPGMKNLTIIGCYGAGEQKVFVNGRDLDKFPEYLKNFDLLVTFNGSMFDVPFLEKTFNMEMKIAHIDLRFALQKIGVKGGLKKVEKKLGLERPEGVADLDGFAAVLLWRMFKESGDEDVLNTLIYYNLEDTVNLEYLMRYVYNQNVCLLEHEQYALEERAVPKIDYNFNEDVVDRIIYQRSKYSS